MLHAHTFCIAFSTNFSIFLYGPGLIRQNHRQWSLIVQPKNHNGDIEQPCRIWWTNHWFRWSVVRFPTCSIRSTHRFMCNPKNAIVQWNENKIDFTKWQSVQLSWVCTKHVFYVHLDLACAHCWKSILNNAHRRIPYPIWPYLPRKSGSTNLYWKNRTHFHRPRSSFRELRRRGWVPFTIHRLIS